MTVIYDTHLHKSIWKVGDKEFYDLYLRPDYILLKNNLATTLVKQTSDYSIYNLNSCLLFNGQDTHLGEIYNYYGDPYYATDNDINRLEKHLIRLLKQ